MIILNIKKGLCIMYTALLFLFIFTIGYFFAFFDDSNLLLLITCSLILAILIRCLYLLSSIHKIIVSENKTLSKRILENRLNNNKD